MAPALVRFLAAQRVERDGVELALCERPGLLPFHAARNEQAMVHAATADARMHDRLAAFACTTSIGPGATNLVTGAACATVNWLPVLLLPARRAGRRPPDRPDGRDPRARGTVGGRAQLRELVGRAGGGGVGDAGGARCAGGVRPRGAGSSPVLVSGRQHFVVPSHSRGMSVPPVAS
jgi:hypothetical protein